MDFLKEEGESPSSRLTDVLKCFKNKTLHHPPSPSF